MTLVGRLHPLLVHFPIALVLVAVAAEAAATVTGRSRFRDAAVLNLRIGAALAFAAALAGWWLARPVRWDVASLLEWHRWLGTSAALVALVAAMTSIGLASASPRRVAAYRIALLVAGALVAAGGHLGGLLVWGTDFLHP